MADPYRLPALPLSYAPRQNHPLGVAALVCGLLAYPTGCCCHLFGLPLSIAAITCGIVGLTRVRAEQDRYTGAGLCIAGIVLGGASIALVVAAVTLGLSLKLFDSLRP